MNTSNITYFHTYYNKLQSIAQDNCGKERVKVNYSKTVQVGNENVYPSTKTSGQGHRRYFNLGE